ncbi:MAG: hypothetical protein OEY96_11780 [Gammaproteobacteria bacterium]|nr:hypothetical protein [Gammaproteobacteria bacterium]
MKTNLKLTIIYFMVIASIFYSLISLSEELPRHLIGKTIEELKQGYSGKISIGDFEDEDTSDGHTQEWFLTLSLNSRVSLFSDNGVVTEIRITDPFFTTIKGVKAGDSLELVKQQYPDSIFKGGSKTKITQEGLFLYSKKDDLVFVFYNKQISEKIIQGNSYDFKDPEVSNIKLWGIYLTNGENK